MPHYGATSTLHIVRASKGTTMATTSKATTTTSKATTATTKVGKVEAAENEHAAAVERRTKPASAGMVAGLEPAMFGRNDRSLIERSAADGGTHQRIAWARSMYDGKGTYFDVRHIALRMLACGAPLWARPYTVSDPDWFVGRAPTGRAMLHGVFERPAGTATFRYVGDDVPALVFANDAALCKAAQASLDKYIAALKAARKGTTDAEVSATPSIARFRQYIAELSK